MNHVALTVLAGLLVGLVGPPWAAVTAAGAAYLVASWCYPTWVSCTGGRVVVRLGPGGAWRHELGVGDVELSKGSWVTALGRTDGGRTGMARSVGVGRGGVVRGWWPAESRFECGAEGVGITVRDVRRLAVGGARPERG